ncbi:MULTISPECIES: aldo/keto reductase [Dethiosulfovibrio]|uniref:Aldo/keto reductase n=2 Tax=Dethiosulfovibrio TaxID=47054 RepID=A0ABS9ETP0_9BACT|nr:MULTISPECIES: aldo/keto reductase [Dethiosulfovibrio]MCF4115096.1 aldo/keto reductase [Dethiosulfovibrio russensis]MCF4143462.1 aldo/keto reductase [Dethiosulfovibrio marinus]MCF4145723.1 aldo/keto reductase [Dethiosulfovibrio acidaminovorans]MEA3283782.1 aldo/keto reductase [Synergistota bacterium]
MKYRKMPKTGDELSALGFGCMRLPMGEDGKVDTDEAVKVIRRGIDGGINYVDTAWPYHDGDGELYLAKALKDGYREKVFLATKLPVWLAEKPEDMDDFLDRQLERLETDHIDYYLVHALNEARWRHAESLKVGGFLDRAKRAGKIKNAGFSFHDGPDLFDAILNAYDWDFCQIQYNFIDRNYQAGKKGLKAAAEKGLGVIVMEPLRGGALVRTVPEDVDKIWRENAPGRSPAQWGLRWLWDQPEVSVVLSGMSSMEQVEDNLEAAEQGYPENLTETERAAVDKAARIYMDRMAVDCTGCRYCMPCPAGVKIPECFAQYNKVTMLDDLAGAKQFYGVFTKDGGKASQCVECGKCETACPQNIQIRKGLKEVARLLEKEN